MEHAVRDLFDRYERSFLRALAGQADMEEIAALYASDVIAASPAGVRSGRNDAAFRQAMATGYARYRDIGTKAMRVRHLRISPMDDLHCVAHVGWRAAYARAGQTDAVVDFEVHYLVQIRDGAARVFGWVTGDEEAVLRRHGIV